MGAQTLCVREDLPLKCVQKSQGGQRNTDIIGGDIIARKAPALHPHQQYGEEIRQLPCTSSPLQHCNKLYSWLCPTLNCALLSHTYNATAAGKTFRRANPCEDISLRNCPDQNVKSDKQKRGKENAGSCPKSINARHVVQQK